MGPIRRQITIVGMAGGKVTGPSSAEALNVLILGSIRRQNV